MPITLTCGSAEENIHNNRAVAETLEAPLHEVTDTHNYTAWRDAFDPHLDAAAGATRGEPGRPRGAVLARDREQRLGGRLRALGPAGARLPRRGRQRLGPREPGHGRRGRGPDRGRAREALLRRRLRRRVVVEPRDPASRSGRATTSATSRGSSTRSCRTSRTTPRRAEIATLGISLGAYHAVNFALKRADLFPLALGFSGNYDPSSWHGWGERGEAAYFNNPFDYLAHMGGDHLDWLRGRISLLLVCGQGQWEDTHRLAGQHEAPRARAAREGHPPRAGPLGARRPARLAALASTTRPSSATVLLMAPTPST